MKIMFIESNPVMIPILPKGFRDAGFDVYVVGSILSKDHLSSLMKLYQPHLIFTQGWAQEQIHAKQQWIRELVVEWRIPHVYWSIEDPIYTDYFVVPLINVSKPDFIFTISSQHVEFYRSLGFPSAHLDWGVHPDVHHPGPADPRYDVDIALIANSYSDTIKQFDAGRIKSMKTLLTPLIQAGIRVDIWGQGWEHMGEHLGVQIPEEWLRGELLYTECNSVYNSAKIILGLQNVETQVTQRTFEVLAAGGLFLTTDIPAVRQLFQPDQHLLVSNTPEETIRLVNTYLNDPAKRQEISRQAREASIKHSYVSRVGYIMKKLSKEGIFDFVNR